LKFDANKIYHIIKEKHNHQTENHLTFIYLPEPENTSKSPQQFHHVACCLEAATATAGPRATSYNKHNPPN